MEVIVLQVFVSLFLVLGSILLFAHGARQRDHEHVDRLALLPVEPDGEPPTLPHREIPQTTRPEAQPE